MVSKKLFYNILFFLCLSVKAQEASVLWNNFTTHKDSKFLDYSKIELNGNYFAISRVGGLNYVLHKFAEDLSTTKTIEFPIKYEGNELEYLGLTKGDSKVIVLFKYYETKGNNRYVFIKASFDINMSNNINFEKIDDIETQGPATPSHIFGLYYLNSQRDVVSLKVPRTAFSIGGFPNSYVFTSYNNDFTKIAWTANMDLSKYSDDYVIKAGYFTKNQEYIFIMKAKLKAFAKIKNDMLICKFKKDQGLTIKEVKFEENDNSFNFNILIDSNSNTANLYGVIDRKGSKEDWLFLKQFNIDNLVETNSNVISLGLKKLNGLNTDADISDLKFRWVEKDKENGSFTLLGEIFVNYKFHMGPNGNSYSTPGLSASILYVKLDTKGNLINKVVIPRNQKVDSEESPYSSFIATVSSNKVQFVFCDNVMNKNIITFIPKIKVKKTSDIVDKDNDIYIVTVDENSNISKKVLEVDNIGVTDKLNKNADFEIRTSTYISAGKFLVLQGNNIGLLSIK